jgi:hypothetical protein
MKTIRLFGLLFFTWLTQARALDDFLDRLGETLTINAFEGQFRAQLRGTLDFEFYHLDGPAPSLIYTNDDILLNPRLTLFLDSQIGPAVYVFAQARVDRGFDPSDSGVELRADEYAVRITPWQDGRFNLQIGKFATVVGNWVERHHSWENPFVTAPLPYDYLLGLWDSQAPRNGATLLGWAHISSYPGEFTTNENIDKKLRIPLIWGPSYASGIALSGRLGKFDYAVEMKNTSLSSRPDYWDVTQTSFQYPTFSGRLGFRPDEMWNFGFSASNGAYLNEVAESTLPHGRSLDDYREIVVGEDIAFAWHHLQIWAESYQARFKIPIVGDVDTWAYYLEAKYKFTPELFGAIRWNQQLFSEVRDRGSISTWSRDVWEIDSAIGYRFTAHLQLKLQYSLQRQESGPQEYGHTIATQFTLRF